MHSVFVGGPMHGTAMDLDPAPDRYTAQDDEGNVFVYRKMLTDAMGVGTAPMHNYQAWYAPIEMSLQEFGVTRKTIPPNVWRP